MRASPLIDMLRASSPFHAAYMVRGVKPEDDRCIFSGLLNEALSGAHECRFRGARPAPHQQFQPGEASWRPSPPARGRL